MREYDVLYTLSKCAGPVRIGELNRHVLLSQPALSRLVDRLAERGLVERQPDPADGRGVRLSLTDAGRVVQRRIGRQHARGVARAMTAGLSPGELAQLETICLKLAADPAAARRATRTTGNDRAKGDTEPELRQHLSSRWSAPAPAIRRRPGCWPTAPPSAPSALAAGRGHTVTVSVVELREIAADISTALVSQLITPKLQQAITVLARSRRHHRRRPGLQGRPQRPVHVVLQVLDNDLLIAKPVVLAATAGTARHALVADASMRPMFAYLRTMTAPTSLFAAPEDWGDPALAHAHRPGRVRARAPDGKRLRPQDQGRGLAELPARVRQRRRRRDSPSTSTPTSCASPPAAPPANPLTPTRLVGVPAPPREQVQRPSTIPVTLMPPSAAAAAPHSGRPGFQQGERLVDALRTCPRGPPARWTSPPTAS